MESTQDVAAVVVTYGDRAALCSRCVNGALGAGAAHVVVVDNGSSETSTAELRRLVSERVHVIPLDKNLGSAAGYSIGIDRALSLPVGYVWLLDDDNEAERGALRRLQAVFAAQSGEPGVTALLSFRPDRTLQRRVASGESPDAVYPRSGAFLYFNALQRLGSRRRRASRDAVPDIIPVPYGPYGGLYAPVALLQAIGFPDRRLVLYEDDAEFTARIPNAGGQLLLVRSSVVHDRDGNWLGPDSRCGPVRLLESDARPRLFYSVRNRTHFEIMGLTSRQRIVRRCNKVVLLTLLWLLAVRSPQRRRNLRLILSAVRDGERGVLGPMEAAVLP